MYEIRLIYIYIYIYSFDGIYMKQSVKLEQLHVW